MEANAQNSSKDEKLQNKIIMMEGQEEIKKEKNTFKRIQELQKLIKQISELREYCM